MRAKRDQVRAIATRIVGAMPRGEPFDFVDTVAARIPAELIATVLDRAPRRGVTAPIMVQARVCPDGQSAVSAAGTDAFS
jgi:cytochrome P450